MARARAATLVLLAVVGCHAPGEGSSTPPPPPPAVRRGPPPPAVFALRSPAFADGETIPAAFTCDGRDGSPPLGWEAAPRRTRSFALVVEDPDAPGGSFVHWLLWGIPGSTTSLPEGVKPAAGMREGTGGFRTSGWRGPCPPPGAPHRYHFRLYALDVTPSVPPGSDRLRLHAAMLGHILAESVLTGRYGRPPR